MEEGLIWMDDKHLTTHVHALLAEAMLNALIGAPAKSGQGKATSRTRGSDTD